ncbi:MAG: lipopolysaccharide kinase InaA family protein [Sedimentisphaerales bacterium]|nr:lipopolysaccharide kinase InaA family protein [Sedimentisphaerales bacterium]
MAEFPFQLLINCTYPRKRSEFLLCTALLRVIPGRRKVYDASWGNKSVIAKVFSHKISARRHLRREWRGLKILASQGINAPEPLFYGHTEEGHRVVVVQKIPESSTILDVFLKTPEPAKKLNLLALVRNEMAKQHIKGVLQKDLHLGNFLLSNDKVFALDAGQMHFLRHEADRKSSISQLAMLAFYLPDSDKPSITAFCEEYFKARGWHFGNADQTLFQKQLAAHQRKMVRKGLKKCMRTGKRQLRVKTNRYIAIFDKVYCQEIKLPVFIEDLDKLMDKGQILKNGNTCYVSRLMLNGQDVVIKRYNHKGFIHSLRHTIKKSRARRGWLQGHRLGMLNIATPKPLAYIELLKKKLMWKSYLITEYVDGQKLFDFLQDSNVTKDQHLMIIQQIKVLLDKMGEYRITHGDLKHSNILVTDNGPVLTDLDGMKAHKLDWTYKSRRTKDLQRFGKYE